MALDNNSIADQFSMLAKLMDIHGDNSFKAKSYATAAFTIDKLPVQLTDLPPEKISSLKGIGDSTAKKIHEIIRTGAFPALESYILKTPPGVIEMLSLKGLGPKKIAVIWKEMEIESPGELLYACTENRLTRYKGFGEKSQKSIEEAIQFYLKSQGNHLYAEIEKYAIGMTAMLLKAFPNYRFELTGGIKRQLPTIDRIEWVTSVPVEKLQDFFTTHHYIREEILTGNSSFRTPEGVLIQFHSRANEVFEQALIETSSSQAFIAAWNEKYSGDYSRIQVVPPFLREKPDTIKKIEELENISIIQPSDIRGIIHSHSTWSDGSHTIEEMARACIEKGYEYLVISDHSKSAAYAQGLTEDRVLEQHRQIDDLNRQLAPFRIFKSIESDILGDGSLDYDEDILASFDLVIASIHSNLKMTEEKAMARLLKAITNPYTRILGHLTGRLLLSRPGYPVDYRTIIDACSAHHVVIEINANPRRLDMDWEWIDYATSKNVLLSIDPDAHNIREYDNCRYGVLAAQKGALQKHQNLSSYSLNQFEAFLSSKGSLT